MAKAATPVAALPRTWVLNPADLRERLMAGTFPAVIFSGPEGSGKMTLAIWWACALNCAQGGCGTCRTCRLLLSRHHPDLTVLAPAEDTTGLKIEQIRDMQDRLNYRPVEARYRFVILDKAETLTEGASNALLKTLEEPPVDTVMVLLASHHAALLPTVQSRCRRFTLLPVDVERVAAWLVQEGGVEPTRAALAARLAEGAPGRASAMLADAAWWQAREEALELYAEICDGRVAPLRAAAAADDICKGGRDKQMRHLELGATWLRDCLVAAQRQAQGLEVGPPHLINLDRVDRVVRQASQRPAAAWAEAVRQVAEARRQLKANANAKLQVQLLLQQVGGV